MKQLVAICAFAIFLMACGGGGIGGSSKVDIKIGGKNASLETKASGTYKTVKTFTDINKNITKAIAFDVYLANYDMDGTNPMTMKKPMTAPEQVRLILQLIGEEGTDHNSELKAGTYKADPTGKFMKLDYLSVVTFADVKEVNTSFDTSFSTSKITGQVTVTSVTADSISGTIDVTEGDKAVKGPFTAKIAAKK